jgi:hypothetical protein
MASERQIAASRRNAAKSTGPRSASGKKRASKNAVRHGLTKPMLGPEYTRALEALARQIAGDREDKLAMALARDAAEAELELARVRRMKVALIERVAVFGCFNPPRLFRQPKDEIAWIMQRDFGATRRGTHPNFAIASLPAMPAEEPERTAEAVRRALPELVKLTRYETRAVLRRDRAIREITKITSSRDRLT